LQFEPISVEVEKNEDEDREEERTIDARAL
jgi:hypothetical protein